MSKKMILAMLTGILVCGTVTAQQVCVQCRGGYRERTKVKQRVIAPVSTMIIATDEEFVQTENEILEEINAERAKFKLPPLAMCQQERTRCRQHSRAMSSCGSLFHATGVVECVAMSNTKNGRIVARQWLASPGHRSIVMGRYSSVSIGTFGPYHTLRVYSIEPAVPTKEETQGE